MTHYDYRRSRLLWTSKGDVMESPGASAPFQILAKAATNHGDLAGAWALLGDGSLTASHVFYR